MGAMGSVHPTATANRATQPTFDMYTHDPQDEYLGVDGSTVRGLPGDADHPQDEYLAMGSVHPTATANRATQPTFDMYTHDPEINFLRVDDNTSRGPTNADN